MKASSYIILTALLITVPFAAKSEIATSFNAAKVHMYKKVFPNSGQTFYTNCNWSKKKVNLASCGLENSFPKKHMNRASRTEAEHIIPASWMLKKNKIERSCVAESKGNKYSPRRYCQKHDKDFRRAHNDLVNLRPVVGEINANRSNKPFLGSLTGSKPMTYRGNGKVFKVSSRVAVPDISIRGDIARVAFYMRDTYGVSYSTRQLEVFNEWNKQDAISEEEALLNQRIQKVQGVGNKYVLGGF